MRRLLPALAISLAFTCGDGGPREVVRRSPEAVLASARRLDEAPFLDSAFAIQTPAWFIKVWRQGLVSMRSDKKSRELFLPLAQGFWITSLHFAQAGRVLLLYQTITDGEETRASVLAVDLKRCRVLWEVEIPQTCPQQPVLLDSAVYLVSGTKIGRIEIGEGQLLWDRTYEED